LDGSNSFLFSLLAAKKSGMQWNTQALDRFQTLDRFQALKRAHGRLNSTKARLKPSNGNPGGGDEYRMI
jgi:hypothetical protein